MSLEPANRSVGDMSYRPYGPLVAATIFTTFVAPKLLEPVGPVQWATTLALIPGAYIITLDSLNTFCNIPSALVVCTNAVALQLLQPESWATRLATVALSTGALAGASELSKRLYHRYWKTPEVSVTKVSLQTSSLDNKGDEGNIREAETETKNESPAASSKAEEEEGDEEDPPELVDMSSQTQNTSPPASPKANLSPPVDQTKRGSSAEEEEVDKGDVELPDTEEGSPVDLTSLQHSQEARAAELPESQGEPKDVDLSLESPVIVDPEPSVSPRESKKISTPPLVAQEEPEAEDEELPSLSPPASPKAEDLPPVPQIIVSPEFSNGGEPPTAAASATPPPPARKPKPITPDVLKRRGWRPDGTRAPK